MKPLFGVYVLGKNGMWLLWRRFQISVFDAWEKISAFIITKFNMFKCNGDFSNWLRSLWILEVSKNGVFGLECFCAWFWLYEIAE